MVSGVGDIERAVRSEGECRRLREARKARRPVPKARHVHAAGDGAEHAGGGQLPDRVAPLVDGKRSPSVKLSPHARVASQRLLFTGQQRRGRLVAHVGLQSIGEKLQDITVLQL